MAPVVRRALLALGSVAAASPLDHQVLVQQAAKPHHGQPSLKDLLGILPDTKDAPSKTAAKKEETKKRPCTLKERQTSEETLKLHKEKAAEVQKTRTKLILQEIRQVLADAEQTLEAFAQPFVDGTKESFKMMAKAAEPIIKLDIQLLLEKLGKSTEPVNTTATEVALAEAGSHLGQDIDNLQPAFKDMVHCAIRKFDELIAAKAKQDYPELAPILASLPAELPQDLTKSMEFMGDHMKAKALPVVVAEAFPEVAKALAVILKSDPPADPAAFFQEQMLPIMPKECQKMEESLQSLTGGKDDDKLKTVKKAAELQPTVSECLSMMKKMRKPLDLPQVPEEPDVPTKHCLSCAEVVGEHIIKPFDKYSCLMSCGPTVPACMSALDDKCMHGLGGCVKCFTQSLMQLPGCEGDDDQTELLSKAKSLGEVFAKGSLGKSGIDNLSKEIADHFVDFLVPQH